MSAIATRQDIDEILGVIRDFMGHVDARFNKVEADVSELKFDVSGLKFDVHGLKQGVSELNQRMSNLEKSNNWLFNAIDGFVGRIDHYEVEQAARDHQFARLVAWAKKEAAKTGVPLKDL